MTRRIRIAVFVLIVAIALWLDPIWAVAPVVLFRPVFATCTIFSDDFSTDQLATAYSTSGTMSVSGGVLTMTTANATAFANTGYGAGATAVYVTDVITCATTSDIGRLIAARVDDSTYWFAEVQPGATNGTLKLYERSGGVNTQRGSTQTVTSFNATEALAVCLSIANGYVVASATIGGATATVIYAASPTVASTTAGMGSGSGSSSVSHDDFAINTHRKDNSSCRECSVAGCSSLCSTFPPYLVITFSGLSTDRDPGGLMQSCGCMNASFVIPANPSAFCQSQSITYDCGFPDGGTITWTFTNNAGQTHLTVNLSTNCAVPNPDSYTFEIDLGTSPVDCRIDTDVPNTSSPSSGVTCHAAY